MAASFVWLNVAKNAEVRATFNTWRSWIDIHLYTIRLPGTARNIREMKTH